MPEESYSEIPVPILDTMGEQLRRLSDFQNERSALSEARRGANVLLFRLSGGNNPMTNEELLGLAFAAVVAFVMIRAAYRWMAFDRRERAFLSLAAKRGVDRARALEFINLARAKGTTAMEEVSAEARAMEGNELSTARKEAGIAVMERAARDEFRRLTLEGRLKTFEEISDAADAAGIAMINQYVEHGSPLGPDSPMGVAALRALIDNCNDDIRGVPEGQYYVTQLGRVARAGLSG
jgi:hypothetical protein